MLYLVGALGFTSSSFCGVTCCNDEQKATDDEYKSVRVLNLVDPSEPLF